jgi:hypothetical protein
VTFNGRWTSFTDDELRDIRDGLSALIKGITKQQRKCSHVLGQAYEERIRRMCLLNNELMDHLEPGGP